MAENSQPGHRAQAALRAARLVAVAANRPRLDLAVDTPAGRRVWTELGREPSWSEEDRLIWLNAPNAWLEGSTPLEEIERNDGIEFSDGLQLALRAARRNLYPD